MTLTTVASLFSNSVFLSFVAGIPLIASLRKIKVYDCFIEGAKEGIDIIIKIIPYLVAMIVAIKMLRASGFFVLLTTWLAPVLTRLNIPSDILPLALLRPFSGTGSNAILAELVKHYGGNAYISKLAATMMGSTETTFYVLAIYFG